MEFDEARHKAKQAVPLLTGQALLAERANPCNTQKGSVSRRARDLGRGVIDDVFPFQETFYPAQVLNLSSAISIMALLNAFPSL
jgi:hypothetical protein